jgi:hypothetical protein
MIMKKMIILLGVLISLLPTTIVAQKKYFNLDFEKADTSGKKICTWEDQNRGTLFNIDSTKSDTGKSCLLMMIKHVTGYATYNMLLPKTYYSGMRTINISVKIQMRNTTPNAGLWCKIKNDNDLLGYASTIKGSIPSPIIPYNGSNTTNVPVIPYTWTSYNFEIKIDKDPTEVMIGLFLANDRAWYDNIKININGKPVKDMVFEMAVDN